MAAAEEDEQPTREQLETLLALQDADQQIRRLRHQLDNLPEQQALDEAETEVEGAEQEHAEHRVELDLVAPKVKKLEDEISMLEQRKAADQERLYGGNIANPRELQGLRADIESTDRRITEHEDALLEVLEEQERIQSTLDRLTERSASLQREVDAKQDERDAAAKDLLAELAEAEVERDARRGELPDDLLATYDEARERFKGLAVGTLDGHMCTGCRIDLPRIEVSELKQGPPLSRCPECRRLLVLV